MLLAATIAIVVSEIAARVLEFRADTSPSAPVGSSETLVFAPHPLLGWAPVPGTAFSIQGSDGVVSDSFNSLGLLGAEMSTARSPGSFRVLLRGDSMTAARQVARADRFATRLERGIQDRVTGGTIEVLNAGRDGYQTDQEILFYETEGRLLRSDLVILAFFPANDVMNLLVHDTPTGSGWARKPRFILDPSGRPILRLPADAPTRAATPAGPAPNEEMFASDPARAMLYRASALYRLYVRARENWAAHCTLPEAREVYRRSDTGNTEEAWRLARALFARVAAQTDSDGAKLAVVLIPEELQMSGPIGWAWAFDVCGLSSTQWSPDVPIAKFAAMCGELELRCLDLTPRMRSEGGRLFLRDGHLAPSGHEVVSPCCATG
ncbi:MAG: SGNH/GDSL hydrolase family protein [Elusimicrobia bacterium]|nr:SGNH/GDSL hydrolase family protein [Elusimicrobiota bacterium]